MSKSLRSLLSKSISKLFRTEFYVFRRATWRNSFWKYIFSLSFPDLEGWINVTFEKSDFDRPVGSAFYASKEPFWGKKYRDQINLCELFQNLNEKILAGDQNRCLPVQCNVSKKNLFFDWNLIPWHCRTEKEKLWRKISNLHSLAPEKLFEQNFTQLEFSYFCYRFHYLGEIFGTFAREICRVVNLAFFNCSGAFWGRGSSAGKTFTCSHFSESEQKPCNLFVKRFRQVFHSWIRCAQRTKLKENIFLTNSHFYYLYRTFIVKIMWFFTKCIMAGLSEMHSMQSQKFLKEIVFLKN